MKNFPLSEKEIDLLIVEASEQNEGKAEQLEALLIQAREMAYANGIAHCLMHLSGVSQSQSDYPSLLEQILEAIDLFKLLKDKINEAHCLNLLGFVYNFLGDHKSRLKSNLRSLRLKQDVGDRKAEIGSLNNVGDTYLKLEDYDEALHYFDLCLNHKSLSESSRGLIVHNIGEVYFAKGALSEAIPYFREAMAIADAHQKVGIMVVSRIFLSDALLQLGKLDEVEHILTKSLELVKENGLKEDAPQIYKNFSRLYDALSESTKAYHYFKMFHEARERIYNEETIQKIKNIQFEHEAESLKKLTATERSKNQQMRVAFEKIEHQKEEINKQNVSITGSIRYAKHLQNAMLPNAEIFKKNFADVFIYYHPKDIVSGDFYWIREVDNKLFFAVADCTGHGVPGAFLSIVCMNLLDKAITEFKLMQPAAILDQVNASVQAIFNANGEALKDGMDIALCCKNMDTGETLFSGANNPVYIVREKQSQSGSSFELEVVRGDKKPIGIYHKSVPFTQHLLPLRENDIVYLFTDGIPDQFGGPKRKKFKYAPLRQLLLDGAALPMKEQSEKINQALKAWQGDLDQVDDVCLIGIKI